MPQWVLRENLGVPENDQSIFRSSERDIETTRIAQKSNALMIIRNEHKTTR